VRGRDSVGGGSVVVVAEFGGGGRQELTPSPSCLACS